jgi:hypothetical protein
MMEGDIREATEKMRTFLIAAPTSGAGSIEDMSFIILSSWEKNPRVSHRSIMRKENQ